MKAAWRHFWNIDEITCPGEKCFPITKDGQYYIDDHHLFLSSALLSDSLVKDLNAILEITGKDADSFEGQKLLSDLRRDSEFQKNLGFQDEGILGGGGTTDQPIYGLYDIGNFLFGIRTLPFSGCKG